MSDYSEVYFTAQKIVKMDVYVPEFSRSLATLEAFAQPQLDYATSRMRAISQSMIIDPGCWEINRDLISMLDIETVCAQNID